MRKSFMLAIGILGVGLAGCGNSEGDADSASTTPTGGIEAGMTKSEAGGGGAAAPTDAMAAPPGVKTGTPGG